MLVKSRAIVLHITKYNDVSSIATLYTEKEGALSFVVRIPKTSRAAIKSKMFQPLVLLEIEWDMRENQRLQRLKNCRIWKSYTTMPYHPLKNPVGLFLYEFLYHALKNEKPNLSAFDYVLNSLLWFDESEKQFANFHLIFLFQLTCFLGFEPNVGHKANTDIFDMQNGCYVNTIPQHTDYIKGDDTRILPILQRVNYRTMHLMPISRQERVRVLEVLCQYYRLQLPDFPEIKSLEILHGLFD